VPSRISFIIKSGRWKAFLGACLGIAVLLLGFSRLRLDVDVLGLLPAELPVVEGLRLHRQSFTSVGELLITLKGSDPNRTAGAARMLAEPLLQQKEWVASVVWRAPWLDQPEELAELTAYLWFNQPPARFHELAQRLAPANLDAMLQDARDRLATSLSPLEIAQLGYDPFGLTTLPSQSAGERKDSWSTESGFTSEDGTFRLLFVQARPDLSDYRNAAQWFSAIRALVEDVRLHPDWPREVQVRYTGAVPFITETALGMESDLQQSVLITLILIAALFGMVHRSWRPLVLLVTTLALVDAGALAAGGLIFGQLNAVSLGFAAVLLGLSVDYALVLYEESSAMPHAPAAEVSRLIAPGIWGSAATTAAAFGLLHFIGLPGLSQLGTLVAIGVLLAAWTMLRIFLPLLKRFVPPQSRKTSQPSAPALDEAPRSPALLRRLSLAITALAAALLWCNPPAVDHTDRPLQSRESAAQQALAEFEQELDHHGPSLLLLVRGASELEVADRLRTLGLRLQEAATQGSIQTYQLPTGIWPNPDHQSHNRQNAALIAGQSRSLHQAARDAGFTSEAMALTGQMLRIWEELSESSTTIWPTNQSATWILRRAAARTESAWLAVGSLTPTGDALSAIHTLDSSAESQGVWLTGWPLLGDALLRHVEARLAPVLLVLVTLVVACLWLTFGRLFEVCLSLGTIAFSLLLLCACMSLANWTWNLMSLVALPLLIGAGVDYTIQVQLAMRRQNGHVAAMRRVTGRAVALCAATTAAGFASNSFAGNAGLASLGVVCSLGITIVCVSSIGLLPAWWLRFDAVSRRKSRLYGARWWKLSLLTARLLPPSWVRFVGTSLADLHFLVRRERRRIVQTNILPVCQGNPALASQVTRRIYRNFGAKLADLWRVESGIPVTNWITVAGELDVIQVAAARKRGVLFLTSHLGNWEHGGLLLSQLNIPLTVLTQAEPDDELTRIRVESRARWGIQTLLIGKDAFALLEVIQRLQSGAYLAISVDGPAHHGHVLVDFFGNPFAASPVAAELARATGCALIGVTTLRRPQGYEVRVLPEFAYDRQELSSRPARTALTQRILQAFEPRIRQDLDQWFQFVPIWPASPNPPPLAK